MSPPAIGGKRAIYDVMSGSGAALASKLRDAGGARRAYERRTRCHRPDADGLASTHLLSTQAKESSL